MFRHPRRLLITALSVALAICGAGGAAVAQPKPPPPLPAGKLWPFSIAKGEGTVIFLVVDSVKAHDGLIDFTTLMIWSPPTGSGKAKMEQAMVDSVFNCTDHTLEQLAASAYDEAGIGVSLGDEAKGPPRPIPPGSGHETLAGLLCAGDELDSSIMFTGDQAALTVARALLAKR